MLESVEVDTVAEIAAKEKINPSYVSRVLRLTLLAPDIIEAVMDGRQPPALGVHALREGFPAEWGEQRTSLTNRRIVGREL